jgi:hypothetical protein
MMGVRVETADGAVFLVAYNSIKQAAEDPGLRALMSAGEGTHCSIWVRDQRVTREIESWPEFDRQLRDNTRTIELLSSPPRRRQ